MIPVLKAFDKYLQSACKFNRIDPVGPEMMQLRNKKILAPVPERRKKSETGFLTLTSLPCEIIIMIFSFLSTSCLLCRVARVCKSFNRLSKDCCVHLDVGSGSSALPKPIFNFLCSPGLGNLRSLVINDFVSMPELNMIAEARKSSLVKLTLSDSFTEWCSSDYERSWQARNHCKLLTPFLRRFGDGDRNLNFVRQLTKVNSLHLNFVSAITLPSNSLPAMREVTIKYFHNRCEAKSCNCDELACVTLAKACPNLKSFKFSMLDRHVTSQTFADVVASCPLLEVIEWDVSGFGQQVAVNDAVDRICKNLPHLKILDLDGWCMNEQSEKNILGSCKNLKAFCLGKRLFLKTGETLQDLHRFFGYSPNQRRFETPLRF